MPFGFSVGDFVAATQIATRAIGSLTASENKDNQDSVIILSFRSLQAQRIKELQQKLYECSLGRVEGLDKKAPGVVLRESSSPLEIYNGEMSLAGVNNELDQLLNDYARAIRNYETLSQEALDLNSLFAESRFKRIFRHISGSPNVKYGSLGKDLEVALRDPKLSLNFRELNKDIREAKMQKQAFSERIWMGPLGGVAVIGPMILMSLHRTLATSLITSSVATVLFTPVLALGARNLKG